MFSSANLLVVATLLLQSASARPPRQYPADFSIFSEDTASASDPASHCRSLSTYTGFTNTTIVNATYYPAAAPIDGIPQNQCTIEAPPTDITVPLCRVSLVVNTTSTSQVKAEMWLPDEWYGRFLSIGNAGLNGCVDYTGLTYGSAFHFATISANNGHDGGEYSGLAFYQNPEAVNDFTTRSIHASSLVGKEITKQYYSQPSNKAYYIGCSTGGRQGAYSALHFPDDFDGIVAGAPATDWHGVTGGAAMWSKYVGAPNGTSSPSFITQDEWGLVNKQVMRQCDLLDGLEDQIITEPDNCHFEPEALLCSSSSANNGTCLTSPQVEALKKIYTPLYDDSGKFIWPSYAPGGESNYRADLFSGDIIGFADGWWRYVIYSDPSYDFRKFGVKDIAVANQKNPGQVSTFDGHLAAFRDRGGKYLAYHGTHDSIIPPANSKRMYELVAKTLSTPILDDFYRVFMVPGMDHCAGGKGGYWHLGQAQAAIPSKNDTMHNVLLAVVDWVEGDHAPDHFVGTTDGGDERVACRYPVQSTVWDGEKYVCK